MKAAVLNSFGGVPKYQDFPEPTPKNEGQILISVTAASIKNLDRIMASGKTYSKTNQLPAAVGFDGVGVLENGERVYAQGITGMLAEKALVSKDRYIPLPNKIDDVLAAAVPNAVLGSAMALRYRAEIKEGDVVLINGATGVTGQFAVQTAKHFGASIVIATGRNSRQLERLKNSAPI